MWLAAYMQLWMSNCWVDISINPAIFLQTASSTWHHHLQHGFLTQPNLFGIFLWNYQPVHCISFLSISVFFWYISQSAIWNFVFLFCSYFLVEVQLARWKLASNWDSPPDFLLWLPRKDHFLRCFTVLFVVFTMYIWIIPHYIFSRCNKVHLWGKTREQ